MKIVILDGMLKIRGFELGWDQAVGGTDGLRQNALTGHGGNPKAHRQCGGCSHQQNPLSRATIERAPSLRFIGLLSTGYNVVDLAAAKEKGHSCQQCA